MHNLNISTVCGVVARIIQETAARASYGFEKYKKTLDRNDLTKKEWLQHAKEESMDLTNYLECCIIKEEEIDTVLEERYKELHESSKALFEHFHHKPDFGRSRHRPQECIDKEHSWYSTYLDLRKRYLDASEKLSKK